MGHHRLPSLNLILGPLLAAHSAAGLACLLGVNISALDQLELTDCGWEYNWLGVSCNFCLSDKDKVFNLELRFVLLEPLLAD